jgi:hypothetical protein
MSGVIGRFHFADLQVAGAGQVAWRLRGWLPQRIAFWRRNGLVGFQGVRRMPGGSFVLGLRFIAFWELGTIGRLLLRPG